MLRVAVWMLLAPLMHQRMKHMLDYVLSLNMKALSSSRLSFEILLINLGLGPSLIE